MDVVRDPSPVAVAARRAAMRRMTAHLETGLLVAVVTGEPEALQDALEAALLTLAAQGAS